jgi:hypothetical protein
MNHRGRLGEFRHDNGSFERHLIYEFGELEGAASRLSARPKQPKITEIQISAQLISR